MDLLPARILKVIGPVGIDRQAAGIIISTTDKTFLIFVGLPEAHAILRELEHEEVKRPMTHDLMMHALMGFGVKVTRVVISSLVDTTYHATVVLEREPPDGAAPDELREEVMLDARASDSMVLALKAGVELQVSRQVVDSAADITEHFGADAVQEAIDELKRALDATKEEGDPDAEGEGWLPPTEYEPDQE